MMSMAILPSLVLKLAFLQLMKTGVALGGGSTNKIDDSRVTIRLNEISATFQSCRLVNLSSQHATFVSVSNVSSALALVGLRGRRSDDGPLSNMQGNIIPLTCSAVLLGGHSSANFTLTNDELGVEAKLQVRLSPSPHVQGLEMSLWVSTAASSGITVTHHTLALGAIALNSNTAAAKKGAGVQTLYWPKASGVRIRDAARADIYGDGNLGNLSLWYAGHASMPVVTMEIPGTAVLSVQARDQTLADLRIEHLPSVNREGASDLFFTKRVPLAPNSSWNVPVTIIALVDGANASWHDAADIYRAWAHTWMPEPHYATWQRMQSVQNGPHSMAKSGTNCSHLWPSCESIPTLAFRNLIKFQRDGFLGEGALKGSCEPQVPGATRMCGPDLWMSGQMVWAHGCCFRFYQPDPFLGTEADLTEANVNIAVRGGRTVYYTNAFNWDAPAIPARPGHAGFPLDLPPKYSRIALNTSNPASFDGSWASINTAPCLLYDKSGEPDAAGVDGFCNNQQPGRSLYPVAFHLLCPNSKPWLAYLSYWMKRYSSVYKVSAMMSDQIGALYLGHCADGYTTQHTVSQLKALVSAGRDCAGCDPEFGVLIEGTADVYGSFSYNMGNSAPYSRWGHYLPTRVNSSFIFPEFYRYTFPHHVQRTSSFLERNTTFWLGLRGVLFFAIEAARDVVYNGLYRDTKGILSAKSVPVALERSEVRTILGPQSRSVALMVNHWSDRLLQSATFAVDLFAIAAEHHTVTMQSCALFDFEGTEHQSCSVRSQGAITTVTIVGPVCLHEAVVILSMEQSIRAIEWTAPANVYAGSKFQLNVKPACPGCDVHFGNEIVKIAGAGTSATVAVPQIVGPYVVWVNASTKRGMLSSRRSAVVVKPQD